MTNKIKIFIILTLCMAFSYIFVVNTANAYDTQKIKNEKPKASSPKKNLNKAKKAYEAGVIKFKEKDYTGAIENLNITIENNPKNSKAYYCRGVAKLEIEKAKNKENPEYIEAFIDNGIELVPDNADAINDFTKAIEYNFKFTDAYNERGNAKSDSKDFLGAIIDYNKAIELEPKNCEIYLNRAIAKFSVEDYKGCIDDVTKIVNINKYNFKSYKGHINNAGELILENPKIGKAYKLRAFAKSRNADYSGAIQDCNLAIKYNNKDAPAYLMLGELESGQKQYKEALNNLTKAIELNPKYVNAYNERARVKESLNDFRGAINDYNMSIQIINNLLSKPQIGIQVLKLQPESSIAYYSRGQLKEKLYDYTGAIEDYTSILENSSIFDKVLAYDSRAQARQNLNDYTGAINDYNQIIELINSTSEEEIKNELKEDLSGAYFSKANIERNNFKNYKIAINDYSKSIDIFPNNTGAYNNRGNCKSDLNDFIGAYNDYTKIIEISPDDADAYFNRGGINLDLGNKKAAKLDYEKAKDLYLVQKDYDSYRETLDIINNWSKQ